MAGKVESVNITRVSNRTQKEEPDLVVVEEHFEIRVGFGKKPDRQQSTITVTMRTPGDDEHLCLGFLFTEGMVTTASEVLSVKYCSNKVLEDGGENVMRLELDPRIDFNINDFQRNFFTNSSCGVCGKASIDHVKQSCEVVADTGLKVSSTIITALPGKLELAQDVFRHTGGLHACGLFEAKGNLILHKEDVGRHNALDKLIGSLLVEEKLPAQDTILILSGRISFELVQKAEKAGIPIIAAVGAPSSLSISLANEYGVTLIGFLKDNSYNIYTSPHRIII
jgi:FdhD protein